MIMILYTYVYLVVSISVYWVLEWSDMFTVELISIQEILIA